MKKQPKRVLQVVDKMNRGGAETLLMNILRNINRNQYQLYFLCHGNDRFHYQDEIENLGGKIIRIELTKNPFKRINDIRRVIRENKIDIVHAHLQLASVYAMLAAKLEHVPKRVAHSHLTSAGRSGNLFYRFYEWLAKKGIAHFSTELVACGAEAGIYLFGKKQFTIIKNGIELEKFKFDGKKRREFRQMHELAEDAFLIGMVARLETVKNHQFAIKMFKKYCQTDHTARLLLAGRGALQSELENQVKLAKLSDEVCFLGLIEDTPALYSAIDLIIMPSLVEGLPVSLVEAQANSLPCLVSDRVDRKSKLTDNLEFIPITEKDIDQWVEAIAKIKLQKRHHNSAAFAKIATSGYNIKDTVREMIAIYEN